MIDETADYHEIKKELARFRKLFHEAFDAIFVFDTSGQILNVNNSAAELTGYVREQLLGSSAAKLTPSEERVRVRKLLNSFTEPGDVIAVDDIHFKREDGALVPVEVNAKLIKVDGESLILTIARDITERRRIEAELKERNENLVILNRVALEITSRLELPEILMQVAKNAVELVGGDAGAIGFYDEKEQQIEYPFVCRMPESLENVITKQGGSLAGHIMDTKESIIIEDYENYEHAIKEFIDTGVKSVILVPISSRDMAFGVLAVFTLSSKKKFEKRDVWLLEGIARQAAIAIENSRLYEKERYVADILQRSFLPERLPDIPFTSIDVFYTSASDVGRVGGDFYDFIEIRDNLFGLVIGDVSGKGIEAASTTALAKYTLRAYAHRIKRPERVVELTNEAVSRGLEEGKFITMAYVIYDWKSGRIALSNAGHPHPVHFRARTGDAVLLENTNAALGIVEDLRYSSIDARLEAGDVLVLYTDGVIEARRGQDFYGAGRLVRVVEESSHLSAREMAAKIIDEVTGFAGGKLSDDIALSVLKRS